jgi:hypothetical protein
VRIDEVWCRYLEGLSLEPSEQKALAEATADPDRMAEMLEDELLDRGLRALGAGTRTEGSFRVGVERRIEAEVDTRGFLSGVENRIQQRLASRPRRRPGAAILVAGLAVSATIGLLVARKGAETPGRSVARDDSVVLDVHGAANVLRGLRGHPAEPGFPLRQGDSLETTAGGSLAFRLLTGSRIELGSETRLTLKPVDGTRRPLRLARGRLTADLAPLPSDKMIVFLTQHARATVVGTRLELEVEDDETRLVVTEGLVLFENLAKGTLIEVGPGGSARAGRQGSTDGGTNLETVQSAQTLDTSAGIPILRFDFEDGLLPPGFNHGYITSPPPGNDSKHCLIGSLAVKGRGMNAVSFESADPLLLVYSDTIVVSFDYWLAPGVRKALTVQLWNADKKQNYFVTLRDVPTGRWNRAVMRLADLKPMVDRTRPIEEGDRMIDIVVIAGDAAGQPLYLDNLTIEDVLPAELPAASSALEKSTRIPEGR